MCAFNLYVLWGFYYLLAVKAYVAYEHHVSIFSVYMENFY